METFGLEVRDNRFILPTITHEKETQTFNSGADKNGLTPKRVTWAADVRPSRQTDTSPNEFSREYPLPPFRYPGILKHPVISWVMYTGAAAESVLALDLEEEGYVTPPVQSEAEQSPEAQGGGDSDTFWPRDGWSGAKIAAAVGFAFLAGVAAGSRRR